MSADDIAYVIGAVNAWTSADLTTDDVTGTWAGLRPLISDAKSARTADLSRRHRVVVSAEGLVTVTGGKLTTYRKMAADTVDAVLATRPRRGQRRRSTPTARLTLVGGDQGGSPGTTASATAKRLGLDDAAVAHLRGRHGSETGAVLDLCTSRPELATRLHPNLPYIQAEVVWAARVEMARTVSDVLARRTRSSILDRNAALEAAPVVAALLGAELDMDADAQAAQVADFERVVAADLAAEGVAVSS